MLVFQRDMGDSGKNRSLGIEYTNAEIQNIMFSILDPVDSLPECALVLSICSSNPRIPRSDHQRIESAGVVWY
jgi:hypothetical protein